MRHYEIVLIAKPNYDAQADAIVERYRSLVTESGGKIHRYEDWGKKNLAYPIRKITKGHYILMNIEADQEVVAKISSLANTNEVLLRYLVLNLDKAITEQSSVMRAANAQTTRFQQKTHPAGNEAKEAEKRESEVPSAAVNEPADKEPVLQADNAEDDNQQEESV